MAVNKKAFYDARITLERATIFQKSWQVLSLPLLEVWENERNSETSHFSIAMDGM